MTDALNSTLPAAPDWQQFFHRFLAKHGKDGYVQDEGRLIFSDGWTCASDDYAGPYTEPPRDFAALRDLKVRFWRRRYGLIRAALTTAMNEAEGLAELQRNMPGELMVRSPLTWDAETRRYIRQPSKPVSWKQLKKTLKGLEKLLRVAKGKLLDLGESQWPA